MGLDLGCEAERAGRSGGLFAAVVVCRAAVVEFARGIHRCGFVLQGCHEVPTPVDVLDSLAGGVFVLAGVVGNAAITEFAGGHDSDRVGNESKRCTQGDRWGADERCFTRFRTAPGGARERVTSSSHLSGGRPCRLRPCGRAGLA